MRAIVLLSLFIRASCAFFGDNVRSIVLLRAFGRALHDIMS